MRHRWVLFLTWLLVLLTIGTVQAETHFSLVGDSSSDKPLFYLPRGLGRDSKDNLYVADALHHSIKQISNQNKVETVAGIEPKAGNNLIGGGYVNGSIAHACFNLPSDIAVGIDGTMYVCDTGNGVIRKITAEGDVSTFVHKQSSDSLPTSIAVDADGNVYVSDSADHCIRMITPNGKVSIYAGVPGKSGYKNGYASLALFFEPAGITFDANGVMYITDSANHLIRKIENGVVSTVAGKFDAHKEDMYAAGGLVNGTHAEFNFPKDVAVYKGGLFVADTFNHAIRYIDKDGSVTTVLGDGSPGKERFVQSTSLSRPYAIEVSDDFLYISDTYNNEILKVTITDEWLKGCVTRNEMLAAVFSISKMKENTYASKTKIFVGDSIADLREINLTSFEEPVKNFGEIMLPPESVLKAAGYQITRRASGILQIQKGLKMIELDKDDYEIIENVWFMKLTKMKDIFSFSITWFQENNLVVVLY